ncbi:uncharacterized protein LOC62_01G000214 [Vanrija pseudolonga]|uniref:Adhesin domain-containing protein n=1 Tax=Vanrija pseudolonga TaxID=143232 RepID=A0AAF1BEY6_9TREE|nr:hypothetical protein LOC62_01G000214 [Vanrija pseudolonga]
MSLPPYTDEKVPLAADVEAGVVVDNTKGPIEDDTELQVGGGERKRCTMTRRKKFILGAVAITTFFALKGCAKRHMMHGHHGFLDESFGEQFHPGFAHGRPPAPGLEFHTFDGSEGAEPFVRVPATYAPSSIWDMTNDGQVWQTANASLPLRRRPLSVQFADAADARVVVSRGDADKGAVFVESTWEGKGPASGVELALGASDFLFVNGSQGEHVVHIVLPSESKGIKDLSVSGANVRLELHSTAAGVRFKHLAVHATGSVHLPEVIAKAVEIESPTGDIEGHFNVSRHLALRTVTGNINATVHVRPPHHHKDHDHDGHKDHDHDKDDDGHHDKHGPHHGDDHHHKHGEEERAVMGRMPCGGQKKRGLGLFAWIRGDHPDHPKRPPFRLPVFIRATSVSGHVEVRVRKPHFVSTHTVARSATGNVKLLGLPSFHGYFRAAARVGTVKVKAGPKEIKYFHEKESETGKFVDGIVKLGNHTHHDHPDHPDHPKHPDHPDHPKHPDHGDHDHDELKALHHHGDKHHHKHGSKHGDKHHHKHEHGRGFVAKFVGDRLHRFDRIAAWHHRFVGDDDEPDHPRHRRPPPGVSGAIAFTEVGDVVLIL